jgi:eukaryotic-like serine/threonine-protein kinase
MQEQDYPSDRDINIDNGESIKNTSGMKMDKLIRHIQGINNLPTFSQNIIAINRKTASNKTTSASASDLANIILKDYSLTCTLLKLVNSAYYGQQAGAIATVTRAVMVLGIEKVRLTALSLILFEQLHKHSYIDELKDSAISSFMRGLIGGKLAELTAPKMVEECIISAMLHNLGRHLVIFCFPEIYDVIKKKMEQDDMTEQNASFAVLEYTYEDLAIEVLKSWNFPGMIISSLTRLPAGPIEMPESEEDTMRIIANFSDELCNIINQADKEQRTASINSISERYGGFISLSSDQLTGILTEARSQVEKTAAVLNIDIRRSEFLNRLSREIKTTSPDRHAAQDTPAGPTEQEADKSFLGLLSGEDALIAGIHDITNVLLGKAILNDILFMILETMHRGLNFHRVILCIMDNKNKRMTARFALGSVSQQIIDRFWFDVGQYPDVFNTAVTKNLDMIINDTDDQTIKDRIPKWYRSLIGLSSFVICPIVVKDKPIGIFYADKITQGNILSDNEINYMKILRNHALLAIKQH